VGSRMFIADARRWRKALGGGMRQAGVLAAAGLYALENHVQRLAEDHENAEYLAAGLRGLGLNVVPPQTNAVYVDVPAQQIPRFKAHLKQRGVIVTVTPRTRLVTHMDLPRAKIEAALQAFREFPMGSPV
jgi:threonine aldolase